MGFQQEASNAEYAAIARALEAAALRPLAHEPITIYTDAQAAIRRRSRTILALVRPSEVRPSWQGSISQPSTGEDWGLQSNSAGLLPTRGCRGTRRRMNGRSWQRTSQTLTARNTSGLGGTANNQGKPPQVTSALEALDQRPSAGKLRCRRNQRLRGKDTNSCSRLREPRQKPDSGPANANKRLAASFYQLKTGHCLTGQYLAWTKKRPTAKCCWCLHRTQTREHLLN